MPIVRLLLSMGVRVYVVAPPGEFVTAIEETGALFVPWRLKRRSLNPLAVARHLTDIWRTYRRIKPDVVHHFTVQANVYGTVAARLARVRLVVSGITGLGYVGSVGSSSMDFIRRSCLLLLYRTIARLNHLVIFQTRSDREALLGSALRERALVVKGGSGVDLSRFNLDNVSGHDREHIRTELGIAPGMQVVVMASRLLHDKGVADYVEAARLVRCARPDTCFVLAGKTDVGNPRSVPEEELAAWNADGAVQYVGHREDLHVLLAASDVVVHPTYYPEGIPRILIEAAAMGKPVVTTRIPGALEIAHDGVNGAIVSPRNPGELAAAVERLLSDAGVRSRYGAAGRRMAEMEFSDRDVAGAYVAAYADAWMRAHSHRGGGTERTREESPRSPGELIQSPAARFPPVSVIIPARGAENTIEVALDSVTSQEYPGAMEVIVADGSDTPAMRDVIRRRHPTVRIVPNPEKNIPSGLNHALREATGEIVVRCDANARLTPGYVRRTTGTLLRTGAANVGGQQMPVGATFFERAVALAMTTVLGAGDARYRLGGAEGLVDTVYLGAFRRETLNEMGGFDPTLSRNEDYELNWRLRERGKAVWFDPDVVAVGRRLPASRHVAGARQAVFQQWPVEAGDDPATSAVVAGPTIGRPAPRAGSGRLGVRDPGRLRMGGGVSRRLPRRPRGRLPGGRRPPPRARRGPSAHGSGLHALELGCRVLLSAALPWQPFRPTQGHSMTHATTATTSRAR